MGGLILRESVLELSRDYKKGALGQGQFCCQTSVKVAKLSKNVRGHRWVKKNRNTVKVL